ncbi:MAG TPA: caspase family protein, partial [Burkholderiaceae bacterium]|nr:caspase family protein [Burkholderiaceae bacterium]
MNWDAIFGVLIPARGRVLHGVLLRVGAMGLALLCVFSIAAPASGQERTRGIALTEDRIALVIGNAAYKSAPLLNPINDARLVADTLTQAGFKVSLHENLDRRSLFEAMRAFGNRLSDRTIALMYYAGHAVQLRDTNYLIPIDAEVRSEDEIPYAGLDVGFILGRMSHARSRINIVILDACRDNPFLGKTGPVATGLAQMDAPVGTLLAFATAPGKVAEDGAGANTPYTSHLAKNLLTPGLPVEFVFKRVREAVVRETSGRQVPWESSSLQGEFAFVPGMASTASADVDVEAAGEIAFWNSIQAAARADEYRAYLRQYPRGRFAELAKTRIAAFSRDAGAPRDAGQTPGGTGTLATPGGRPDVRPDVRPDARTDVAALAPPAGGARGDLLPRAGDTWRYRVQDRFRIGDLFMTATVAEV